MVAFAGRKSKVRAFEELMEKYGPHDGLRSSEPRSVRKARFKAFLQHSKEIDAVNADSENTFKAEANFLSILTDSEQQSYLGRNSSFAIQTDMDGLDDSLLVVERSELPTSRDWRGKPFRIDFTCGILCLKYW